MNKFLFNAYRFTSANSARIENGNGKNNLGALTADGRYGFDCSGFVNYVLTKGGYTIATTSTATRQTINNDGTLTSEGKKWQAPVAANNVQQGDLVYFSGHVGIVVSFDSSTGLGVFRSSTTSYGVTDATFTTNAVNGSTYWGGSKALVGFTRLTAEYRDANDRWVSSSDTSKRPALEPAPALSAGSTGNTSGFLAQTAWIESRGSPVGYNAINGNALGKYQMKGTQ